MPHVSYGILIWGHFNLGKLQKRAVRFITQSKYLAHTDLFFIKLGLLKIQDIFKLNQVKFYYKYLTKSLPEYFQNLIFTRQSRYNTRRSDDLTPTKVTHVFATKCISHNIPNVIISHISCQEVECATSTLVRASVLPASCGFFPADPQKLFFVGLVGGLHTGCCDVSDVCLASG